MEYKIRLSRVLNAPCNDNVTKGWLGNVTKDIFSQMANDSRVTRALMSKIGVVYTAIYDTIRIARVTGAVSHEEAMSLAKGLYMNWDALMGRAAVNDQQMEVLANICYKILSRSIGTFRIHQNSLAFVAIEQMNSDMKQCNECDCDGDCVCKDCCPRAKNCEDEPKPVRRVTIHVVQRGQEQPQKPANASGDSYAHKMPCATKNEKTEQADPAKVSAGASSPIVQLKPYKVKACSIVNGEVTILAKNDEDAMMIATGVKPTYDQTELWQNFTATSEHPHIEICGEYGDDVITEG